ncbi:heme/hemin ABC transporter substrate-binding protein [Thiomicrospira microaerophila]|uniref:heme/hemin ABC transporter substrate-binding protein n=1 Tax=Thiomicrospira microaerophila TaxID=406020 RepID=UPI0006981692|nr:ABC transporter substrate-binding protein [Thiomicrospira microaerophila]
MLRIKKRRVHNHTPMGIKAWLVLAGFLGLVLLMGFGHKAQAAERIVTIDGSVTEIVFALGLGDQVVGRDITSRYPQAVNDLPDVGYMRQLTVEGVLSLAPTLIIATSDAKPSKMLDRLQASGVRVEIIENTPTLEGILYKVERIAAVLGVPKKGAQLNLTIKRDFEQALAQIQLQQAGLVVKPQGIFVLSVRNGNLSVAGQGSRANELLKMIGVHNPVEQQINNYQLLSAEAAININPDFIFMLEQGVSMSGGQQAVLNNPVLKHTRAFDQQRLIIMPNDALSFGPRLGQMVTQIYQQWQQESMMASTAKASTTNQQAKP